MSSPKHSKQPRDLIRELEALRVSFVKSARAISLLERLNAAKSGIAGTYRVAAHELLRIIKKHKKEP